MDLPQDLKEKIEFLLGQEKIALLTQSAQKLTARYRSPQGVKTFLESRADHLAYLLTRMPATYAALRHVLKTVKQPIGSLLDVGAGPGTGGIAAREEFPALQRIVCLEKDREFISLGKEILSLAEWRPFDLCHDRLTGEVFDLVLCSYAINELPADKQLAALETLWQATGKVLVIVEPGTPAGFARIRQMREKLLSWGAHMVAPCPHANDCPVAGSDWCHFAERVERSSLHRRLKGAELNYEDEKFSYIVVSRTAVVLPESRIIRRPQKCDGHVKLTLCTQAGLQNIVVTKKTKDLYKQARKSEWGSDI